MAEKDQTRLGIAMAGRWIGRILGPDSAYLWMAVIYGVAISLLSLATPISVQLLINSVANTALPAPLFWLSGVLLLLLLIAVGLSALRVHLMAVFERRAFARIVAEITIRAVHAQNPFFGDARRVDLFNRYFDLMTVQKSVPSLLVGGFTIILQSVIGLAVTSFYHPFFLAFNAILVLMVLAIWQLWASSAVRTAVNLSHAKHETARWLESVGGSNGFYKSSRHLSFAMDRSEEMTASYVAAHRRHFRRTFSQTLGFMLVYAVASAALLALGGWLIIQGELSIGQLVAAELILSGVFYGISQLGTYLDIFYELVASLEELTLLFDIPQETQDKTGLIAPPNGTLRLREVLHDGNQFDFEVMAGEQLAVVAAPGASHSLAVLLRRYEQPQRGIVMVGGVDISGLEMYRLRSEVKVLDRPTIVEITIREYLQLSGQTMTNEVMEALDLVGLTERIANLPQGLDTPLSSSGWPLTVGEMMALKLAGALLTKPRVLMLSALYDLLPPRRVAAALSRLRGAGTTTLQFTRRPETVALDGYLWLGRDKQIRCSEMSTLMALASETGGKDALPA